MLRASSEHAGANYQLDDIVTGSANSGVPQARILIEFCEALLAADRERQVRARNALFNTLGGAALADAAGIVASFDAVVKIADASGIPLEPAKASATEQLRQDLNIEQLNG